MLAGTIDRWLGRAVVPFARLRPATEPGHLGTTARRVAAAALVALAVCASATDAEAGPKVTLTYTGEIEGLPAVATIEFEDVRIGPNRIGFFYAGGRAAWARQTATNGRIYVGGEVSTAAARYGLNGDVDGVAAWGYADAFRLDAFENFLVRLDFASDGNYVYIDAFALTPNPLEAGQPTYTFTLDVPPPPDYPALFATLGAALPDPAAAATRGAGRTAEKLLRLRDRAAGASDKASVSQGRALRRHEAKARRALGQLVGAARRADRKGTLGADLATIEGAVAALVAALAA